MCELGFHQRDRLSFGSLGAGRQPRNTFVRVRELNSVLSILSSMYAIYLNFSSPFLPLAANRHFLSVGLYFTVAASVSL